MNRFIEVHTITNNKQCYLNINEIAMVVKSIGGENSIIYVIHGEAPRKFPVKESYEFIVAQINGGK